MSTGQILGGAVGAVIGYVWGGPYGAIMGAGLGMSFGAIVDPVNTDVSRPDVAELSAPTATEGDTIPDLVGTSQISNTAKFLWYANNRSEEITEDAGKGGGGGGYISGYKYYLSFAIGLVLGPSNAIYSIYEGSELLWTSGATPITIDDATNGHVSISVDDRGTIDFYFGTNDQMANDLIEADTGYGLPWHGLCYAVFRDFMIGSANRVGALKFVLRKYPDDTFNANVAIGDYNVNPAHAMRHMVVDRCGVDATRVDDTVWSSVADVLYSESLGVSGLFTGDAATLDYLETIFSHIRGCLYLTSDGKLAPKLLRSDVDLVDMIEIGDDDILEEIDVSRATITSLDNQINGTYTAIEED